MDHSSLSRTGDLIQVGPFFDNKIAESYIEGLSFTNVTLASPSILLALEFQSNSTFSLSKVSIKSVSSDGIVITAQDKDNTSIPLQVEINELSTDSVRSSSSSLLMISENVQLTVRDS